MDLYKEILSKALENEHMVVTFPNLKIDAAAITELVCYRALKQIKEVLEDDSLNDKDCFERIEKIVCIFEALGSDCGNRHDFG